MHALFLNWRCPKHPKAGGAEYATMQLARGLVAKGWQVTWFVAFFPGAAREETIDGVKIVRAGGPLTVQGAARRWYRRQPPNTFDLVVDQSHGLPFFAPAWVREPCLYFIHEITGKIANYMIPWPLGPLYQLFEYLIIFLYRHTPGITVSESTKQEMRRYGHRAPITVIELGLDTKPLPRLPDRSTKEKRPTVILAARLVPLKRPDEAIKMQRELIRRLPDAQLWILGDGDQPYLTYLRRLTTRLKLQTAVKFWGYVSLAKRQELMRRAHVVTITSVKEGWGLTVPESNALGTVAVTYNIAGVRDSNRHGLMSPANTPSALAQTIADLLQNPVEYEQYRRAGWQWSKTLSWSRANRTFQTAIQQSLGHHD